MNTAKVNEAIDEGREKLGEFASKGRDYMASAGSVISDFVQDEPLLATASAFAIGYIAARIVNQMTRR